MKKLLIPGLNTVLDALNRHKKLHLNDNNLSLSLESAARVVKTERGPRYLGADYTTYRYTLTMTLHTVGKLPDLDEPGDPITTYSAAIITAHLQMLPAFYSEFQLRGQARTIHCILAIAGNLHSCRGHRAKLRLVNCLVEWAHAITG